MPNDRRGSADAATPPRTTLHVFRRPSSRSPTQALVAGEEGSADRRRHDGPPTPQPLACLIDRVTQRHFRGSDRGQSGQPQRDLFGRSSHSVGSHLPWIVFPLACAFHVPRWKERLAGWSTPGFTRSGERRAFVGVVLSVEAPPPHHLRNGVDAGMPYPGVCAHPGVPIEHHHRTWISLR